MLKDYEKRRDFSRTKEPAPAPSGAGMGSLRFVVQKHAARRLHYDFRLELDGVLLSWAVPKGPSLDPGEKSLAVLVEDHPLDYATFEGVIGHGNYGAGQVIVWDAGVYSPDEDGRLCFGQRPEAEERMRQGLEKGKLSFTLRGRKLRGSWTLVKTTRSPKDWLLIKHRDAHADGQREVLEEDRSVQSGLTIDDLKGGRLPDAKSAFGLGLFPQGEGDHALGTEERFPSRMKPMMAGVARKPFSGPDWLFEPKLDGFRVVAYVRPGNVTLLTRNGIDITTRLPDLVADLESQPVEEMVLDGEIVALDDDGLPDFGLLQRSISLEKTNISRGQIGNGVVYYPFDILHYNGRNLRKVPLGHRKGLLEQLLVPGGHVKPVEFVESEGESFFKAAVELGLEGMVAKRRDSTYQPGTRANSWLKVKAVLEQEFIVGGYTIGSGERSITFGALLVGYYQGDELHYAGRVGSGFDQSTLQDLVDRFSTMGADECPFVDDAELDAAENRWVRPELVARVKFAQWTEEDRLRAPVFLGLRADLDPEEVTRESPSAEPSFQVGDVGSSEATAASSQPEIASLLEEIASARDKMILEVEGHKISLTNLDKPLWPAAEGGAPVSKRDLILYYLRMSPYLLAHLKDRPMTLTRYPNGIEGQSFYQKHLDQNPPAFLETVRLFSSHNEGDGDYIMVNNLATLVWLAQLANIELHPWLSRTVPQLDATSLSTEFSGSREAIDASVLNYPDFIVFDLDPYIYSGQEKTGDEPELNKRAFAKGVEVTLALKGILDQLSLSSFLKTSGKTGLHIYVPILRQHDYGITRKTCELIGRFLMQQLPTDITMEWSVSKRSGKIFLDHNQNSRSKNMASIYSLRPLPGAPVSTPLRWDELGSIYPTELTIHTVPERVAGAGDLWAEMLAAKHDLRTLLETVQ